MLANLLTTADDCTCSYMRPQLHEATPTDSALVHKAYILQMHSPNIDSIYVGRCILRIYGSSSWHHNDMTFTTNSMTKLQGWEIPVIDANFGYELIANITSAMSSYLQSLPVRVKWWSPRCSCCSVLPVSTKMVWMLCWRLLRSTRWVLPLNLFCAVCL